MPNYDYVTRGPKEHPYGYTSVAEIGGAHAQAGMDFGILRMKKGDVFEEQKDLECVYLLVYGSVTFEWNGKSETVSRRNCFDDGCTCLWVPAGTHVKITGVAEDTEITVHRTENDKTWEPILFTPATVEDEVRGFGTMNEKCTRIVRTPLDRVRQPKSNFVFGEVINTPGLWSSYPAHVHPHPEIYYYKIFPLDGYGYCELGDDVIKVYNNDTTYIFNSVTHPQVATPGHAFWYMWVIRQDNDDPYISPKYPDTQPTDKWVMAKNVGIWPEVEATNQWK